MMVNARVRRSLITGSQAIVTHNSRNPQPVIGKDFGAASALGVVLLVLTVVLVWAASRLVRLERALHPSEVTQ